MKRRVLAAAIRMSGGLSALSSSVADDVEAEFGRRPTIIAPGVRTSSFAPAPRSPVPTILFASAMRREKGVDVLLQAFAALAAARPDVRLVLCGPGDPAWAFEAAGDALTPYRDRVDVVGAGSPEDLPARYASAHVTVLPSRNEAFGLVLAESLASGTPVVGCSGGGADDIVVDGIGLMVEHGDAVALADAVGAALDLAQQPETAARCVARAKTWDWQGAIGPQHEALYEAVLTNRYADRALEGHDPRTDSERG
jgi:glycosyltransferase involved in cell wall biosynthesis